MYHINFNAESCHNFEIHTFRLVESHKSFGVKMSLKFLEVLQPFSEADTGGVP